VTVSLPLLEKASYLTERSKLATVRLTGPQRAFASNPARKLIWRGANTIGKSVGLAWHVIHALRGTHPFLALPKPPVRILLVSESWAQMDPLCEKLWSFIPRDEIDDRVSYAPGQGFRGYKEPHIPFVTGPGNPTKNRVGSVLHFATYKQGAARIAGGQFHGVAADEPMPEAVFGELMPRLSRYHGWVRLTFTPTPESPDLTYLRDEVAKAHAWHKEHGDWHPGLWQELVTQVDLDALTPRGGLVEVPWKTQAELDELISSYLEVERGMRVGGEWDPISVDRLLTAYGPANLVFEAKVPAGTWYSAIGIDHGAKAGRQAAVLVLCSEDGEEVRYLDEAVSDGRTSPREDATAVLEMLQRNGMSWTDVDHWVGDRAHSGDRFGNAKCNQDLMKAFSHILGQPEHRLRGQGLDLIIPKKERGSMFRGVRLMNGLFKERRAFVHARCQQLIEAITSWNGKLDDPRKDRVDAARYATERLLDERRLQVPSSGFVG
jgi:phage terminase large subunit-like protein